MRGVALWTWALPGTLVGLVLGCLLGIRGARFIDGVLWLQVGRIIPNWAGAQSWAAVVLHKYEKIPLATFYHEDRHATQWAILGALFVPLYLLASVWARLFHGNWYHSNHFEWDARNNAFARLAAPPESNET